MLREQQTVMRSPICTHYRHLHICKLSNVMILLQRGRGVAERKLFCYDILQGRNRSPGPDFVIFSLLTLKDIPNSQKLQTNLKNPCPPSHSPQRSDCKHHAVVAGSLTCRSCRQATSSSPQIRVFKSR